MKVCKDQLLNKPSLMQNTRLGCEIPRSKERPTNPIMNNFNEAEITF